MLPLVPAYLGFITGRSADELQSAHGTARLAIATQGIAFVLGLVAFLLVALVPLRQVRLGSNLLVTAATIFLAVQLISVYRPPVDAVTVGTPLAGEWWVGHGGHALAGDDADGRGHDRVAGPAGGLGPRAGLGGHDRQVTRTSVLVKAVRTY